MDTKGFVVPPGQGAIWNMAPGRSSALKMLNGQTAESVMLFEEVAPADTATPLHTHQDGVARFERRATYVAGYRKTA